MNRRNESKYKNKSKTKGIIGAHIENNKKQYYVVSIIFFIGIIIGVIFVNNISENQRTEISEYLTSSIDLLKHNTNIDDLTLLKDSIGKNSVTALLLWFIGMSVIGISIVYLIVLFRGFILGYTIASSVFVLGMRKRNSFCNLFTTFADYFICSMYISFSGKWN